MTLSMTPAERKTIDTIRVLCADGVQKANSGHPGTPMALAPLAYILYNEQMRFDPADASWPGRDRFVLSIGHASMLQYAMLHLAQVKALDAQGVSTGKEAVSLENIKNFRQLGSPCAGHPEYGHVSGVEMTTGPLGQGLASSVGMAISQIWLAGTYNRPGHSLFSGNVYALCGDGDMMEGVSSEAASLAGTLKLSNLCWIYDDNKITIEGATDLAFRESVKKRFEAYLWNVIEVEDVNDLPTVRKSLNAFESTKDRPTLIIVQSKIAFGAPKMEGSHEAHGAPLGEEEILGAKAFFGLPQDKFLVPQDVYDAFASGIVSNGKAAHESWTKTFDSYRKEYPELARELGAIFNGELPENWAAGIQAFPADPKGMASRASSGKVLNQIAKNIPWMLGGSADLAPSNKSDLTFPEAGEFSTETPTGRNFHFGIREHAMGSIINGMTLCGLRAYGATFFVFADYMRPAIRLSSIMKIPAIYIFTHDSIGVGEDGPTHQPIEQLASLRAIPNLLVIRPGDANEVAETYKTALLQKTTPSILIFTRQNLPTIDRAKFGAAEGLGKGAYILADASGGKPELILIGTGSEVSLCLEAYEKLTAEGIKARIVSMPCWELFEQQSPEYRESVLPSAVTARIAVELGIAQGWEKYIGTKGAFLGLSDFGASAPAETLMKHFGITSENLVALAKKTLGL